MQFLVITNAPTLQKDDAYHAYAPYVKEMDLWFSKVDKVSILSPTNYDKPLLTTSFKRQDLDVVSLPFIQLGGIKHFFKTFILLPGIVFKMFGAMKKADHIHLRCPGNIGLIAAVVQLLFPSKQKTAKYAGNWDPNAKQPWSYRLQKRILSTTSLTKNMQVLVYGDWPDQSKNITPFFTASYHNDVIPKRREPIYKTPFRVLFVGSLAPGKRPLYAVKWIEECNAQGMRCLLDMYGDGTERLQLETYIAENNLQTCVRLYGNQDASILQKAYQEAHFMILPSKSEGWPKVVAEAMFWGAIPLVTPISCVPWMLDNGNRGHLLSLHLEEDVSAFAKAVSDKNALLEMSLAGQRWSQEYTLDTFEKAIEKFI
jgi:glycosyltransferase involved in cell wall biosynthesis